MSTEDFSKGNLSMPIPKPISGMPVAGQPVRRSKKLIVLCDGTGQDSWGSTAANPTNITLMARALSPNGWEWNGKEWVEWEQIVSYHPGVGTFDGNTTFGVMFGTGLSEIVRAAYGFLASNWQDGDRIYVFGFSRGAYVARSVAGLVAEHGLLTKRGMDNFHAVYNTFYRYKEKKPEDDEPPKIYIDEKNTITPEEAGLRQVRPGTVEVVGVYDTVAFHHPITDRLNRWLRWQVFDTVDRPEFENNELSIKVKHVFHALSLDESRMPFQTTLFFLPKEYQHRKPPGQLWDTELKQVWFSGEHSDIGGGMQDPRLSNITLGWMIAELEAKNLLAFNKDYLTDRTTASSESKIPTLWATQGGKNEEVFTSQKTGFPRFFAWLGYFTGKKLFLGVRGIKWIIVHLLYILPGDTGRRMSGLRIPGEYVPIIDFKRVPAFKEQYNTMESLHESINDRILGPDSDNQSEDSGAESQKWKCHALKRAVDNGDSWEKPIDYRNYLYKARYWLQRSFGNERQPKETVTIGMLQGEPQLEVQEIEHLFKNRMRFKGRRKTPWFGHKIPVEIPAVSVIDRSPPQSPDKPPVPV